MRRIENCGALIERLAAVKPLDPEAPSPLVDVPAGGATWVAGAAPSSGSRLIGGGEETSVATPPTWRSNSDT
jgi:hypothetical protein